MQFILAILPFLNIALAATVKKKTAVTITQENLPKMIEIANGPITEHSADVKKRLSLFFENGAIHNYAWLERAASEGFHEAILALAEAYEFGCKYILKDTNKAIETLEKHFGKAVQNPEKYPSIYQAQFRLWRILKAEKDLVSYESHSLFKSVFHKKTDAKISNIIHNAADNEDSEAQYLHALGQSDQQKKQEYLLKASVNGHIMAQYELAIIKYKETTPPKYEEAFKWFSAAAKQGHPTSMIHLAEMYHHGWGCKRNASEAFDLYSEVADGVEADKFKIADRKLLASVYFALANYYDIGILEVQDWLKAWKFYQLAVTTASDKTYYIYRLGLFEASREFNGNCEAINFKIGNESVSTNPCKQFDAAKQSWAPVKNSADLQRRKQAAWSYNAVGHLIKGSLPARKEFEGAPDQENILIKYNLARIDNPATPKIDISANIIDDHFDYALCFEHGIGVEQDIEMAHKIYAADTANPFSRYRLGNLKTKLQICRNHYTYIAGNRTLATLHYDPDDLRKWLAGEDMREFMQKYTLPEFVKKGCPQLTRHMMEFQSVVQKVFEDFKIQSLPLDNPTEYAIKIGLLSTKEKDSKKTETKLTENETVKVPEKEAVKSASVAVKPEDPKAGPSNRPSLKSNPSANRGRVGVSRPKN